MEKKKIKKREKIGKCSKVHVKETRLRNIYTESAHILSQTLSLPKPDLRYLIILFLFTCQLPIQKFLTLVLCILSPFYFSFSIARLIFKRCGMITCVPYSTHTRTHTNTRIMLQVLLKFSTEFNGAACFVLY